MDRTKVYVAHLKDRHIDPVVRVFKDKQGAIECAKKWAAEGADEQSDIIEDVIKGWLFYATYNEEGDCVWVTEQDLE